MSDAATPAQGEQRATPIERLSGAVAATGGALSLAVALLVVVSVVGRRFFNAPIPGDFELVQMATAYRRLQLPALLPGPARQHRGRHLHHLAAAARQRRHRRVLGPRLRRHDGADERVPGIVGTLEHFRNGQTTMVLQFSIWPAHCRLHGAWRCCSTVVALATAGRLLRGRA